MLGTLSVDTCNFYLVRLCLFYITVVFDLLPRTIFNYYKVEPVLTPLVLIDFASFCAISGISRFVFLSFMLSGIIAL